MFLISARTHLGMIRLAVLWRCTRPIAFRNSVCNFLVPFVLGFAPEKSNDDHGHVIAANATSVAVRCKTIIHHIFADFMELLLRGDPSSDELHDRLRRLAIPDT